MVARSSVVQSDEREIDLRFCVPGVLDMRSYCILAALSRGPNEKDGRLETREVRRSVVLIDL